MMDIILPDLVTVLPACSMSSGFQSNVKIDAPTDTNKIKLSIDKPKISGFAGVNNRYTVNLHDQTLSYVDLQILLLLHQQLLDFIHNTQLMGKQGLTISSLIVIYLLIQ